MPSKVICKDQCRQKQLESCSHIEKELFHRLGRGWERRDAGILHRSSTYCNRQNNSSHAYWEAIKKGMSLCTPSFMTVNKIRTCLSGIRTAFPSQEAFMQLIP